MVKVAAIVGGNGPVAACSRRRVREAGRSGERCSGERWMRGAGSGLKVAGPAGAGPRRCWIISASRCAWSSARLPAPWARQISGKLIRAVSISASAAVWVLLNFLCLPPGGPFPPLLSNPLRVERSLLLLTKPIAQSCPLRVACFLPLLTKTMAFETLPTADKALAAVTVGARDTCEDRFSPSLTAVSRPIFFIENPPYPICDDSQRRGFNRKHQQRPGIRRLVACRSAGLDVR